MRARGQSRGRERRDTRQHVTHRRALLRRHLARRLKKVCADGAGGPDAVYVAELRAMHAEARRLYARHIGTQDASAVAHLRDVLIVWERRPRLDHGELVPLA